TDPRNPQLVSSTAFHYAFLSNMAVQGNTVLVTTLGVNYFGGGDIFRQFGDVITVDVSDPAAPVIKDVLENSGGQPYTGSTWKNDSVFVNPTTAYVAGTTATGGDTQTGVGRVLVMDVTDPANIAVLREVHVPGTV